MVEELSPEWLQEKLAASEDVQVIDTRPESRYAAGHIPGARNLPYAELADSIDEIEWRDEIILVCKEGTSSRQAARILESYEGIDDDALIGNLAGGYDAWKYELESVDVTDER